MGKIYTDMEEEIKNMRKQEVISPQQFRSLRGMLKPPYWENPDVFRFLRKYGLDCELSHSGYSIFNYFWKIPDMEENPIFSIPSIWKILWICYQGGRKNLFQRIRRRLKFYLFAKNFCE